MDYELWLRLAEGTDLFALIGSLPLIAITLPASRTCSPASKQTSND